MAKYIQLLAIYIIELFNRNNIKFPVFYQETVQSSYSQLVRALEDLLWVIFGLGALFLVMLFRTVVLLYRRKKLVNFAYNKKNKRTRSYRIIKQRVVDILKEIFLVTVFIVILWLIVSKILPGIIFEYTKSDNGRILKEVIIMSSCFTIAFVLEGLIIYFTCSPSLRIGKHNLYFKNVIMLAIICIVFVVVTFLPKIIHIEQEIRVRIAVIFEALITDIILCHNVSNFLLPLGGKLYHSIVYKSTIKRI